jgi:hypothetical protein
MKLPLNMLLVLTTACSRTVAPPPLRPAVEGHLRAIAARDLDALLPTLTRGEDLPMIAPDGFRYTTRQQYVDFHRTWFANRDGVVLHTEVVHVTAGVDLGNALVRYRYGDVGAWLALTFTLEDGRWRLVFDQNTLTTRRARSR